MSTISVQFSDCPWTTNGTRDIQFTRPDLLHAAVAVGRNWYFRGVSTAGQAHNQARIQEIRSIVDLQGRGAARVTNHYQTVGSTERGKKSFVLGNTICALIAHKELRIPWLVDLEALPHYYQVATQGNRRADFIGRTPSRQHYAFEAKGRSGDPSVKSLDSWKEQVESVRRVNGKKPEARIVSATFVRQDRVIRSLWQDPPSNEGEDLEISEEQFFHAYYRPVLELIGKGDKIEKVEGQDLTVFPELEISVGVHSFVKEALNRNDFEGLVKFAASEYDSKPRTEHEMKGEIELYRESVQVFPDGIIIRA